MVDIKVVIADPKTGKCHQIEAKDDVSKSLMGKKIGEKLKGEMFDLTGYEFEIMGGSDNSGFPMRRDAEGTLKKRILAVEGVGLKRKISKTKKGKLKFHGVRQRKTVAGNTVCETTAQLNVKIVKEGQKKLGPEDAKTEEKKE